MPVRWTLLRTVIKSSFHATKPFNVHCLILVKRGPCGATCRSCIFRPSVIEAEALSNINKWNHEINQFADGKPMARQVELIVNNDGFTNLAVPWFRNGPSNSG